MFEFQIIIIYVCVCVWVNGLCCDASHFAAHRSVVQLHVIDVRCHLHRLVVISKRAFQTNNLDTAEGTVHTKRYFTVKSLVHSHPWCGIKNVSNFFFFFSSLNCVCISQFFLSVISTSSLVLNVELGIACAVATAIITAANIVFCIHRSHRHVSFYKLNPYSGTIVSEYIESI